MFDYPLLEALSEVARLGSFDRAANAMGITTSAVSQRIRALEERVGGVLVVRARPCTLTAAGEKLCAHLGRVGLLEAEVSSDLPGLIGDSGSRNATTVRVAVNADSLAGWFMPAAAAFAVLHDARLDVVRDREELTLEYLRSGSVLAAVTTDPTSIRGCRKLFLGKLRYTALAAPRFMGTCFADAVTPAALAHAPVLRFDARDHLHLRWIVSKTGDTSQGAAHSIPSPHAFVEALMLGMGWGLSPLPLVADELRRGTLVELDPSSSIDVSLYWHHARVGASLLDGLTRCVVRQAHQSLLQG